MGRKSINFKSEEMKELKDVVAFLRDLANKMEKNEVVLRRGMQEERLAIPNTVVMGLESESKRKKGKTKRVFEIEIEWVEGENAPEAVTLV